MNGYSSHSLLHCQVVKFPDLLQPNYRTKVDKTEKWRSIKNSREFSHFQNGRQLNADLLTFYSWFIIDILTPSLVCILHTNFIV